jgi:hypothetical protein
MSGAKPPWGLKFANVRSIQCAHRIAECTPRTGMDASRTEKATPQRIACESDGPPRRYSEDIDAWELDQLCAREPNPTLNTRNIEDVNC